jgi:hypothetical protein
MSRRFTHFVFGCIQLDVHVVVRAMRCVKLAERLPSKLPGGGVRTRASGCVPQGSDRAHEGDTVERRSAHGDFLVV